MMENNLKRIYMFYILYMGKNLNRIYIYIYIYITESLCYTVELIQHYKSINFNFLKYTYRIKNSSYFFFQKRLPNSGVKPQSLTLQEDSLPVESPGKSKNTGVGSLSLLQGNFLTQELNRVSSIAGRFFTNWATWEAQRRASLPIFITTFISKWFWKSQNWVTNAMSESILGLIHDWRCSPTENIIWKAIIIAKPKNPWYM